MGRGAGDLKAGICTALSAFALIERAGIKLYGDVVFAFVGDEESGEVGTSVSAGVKAYVGDIEVGRVKKPDFVIYVEPTQTEVFTAMIGFFIADITITGRSAYFGVPERGKDALKTAHNIMSALWQHSEEQVTLAIVTLDLNEPAALDMVKGGNVAALIGGEAYAIGVTAARAAALSLIDKEIASFLVVDSQIITDENIKQGWQKSLNEDVPASILDVLK